MIVFAVYLRSRRLSAITTAGLVVAVAGWMIGRASVGVPSLRALDHIQLPIASLLPLAMAVVCSTFGRSAVAELEATFPIYHRLYRFGYVGVVVLVSVLALSPVTVTAGGYGFGSALRNFLGQLGLALLGSVLGGANGSWLFPTTFTLAATMLARGRDGQLAAWAWTVQPGNSRTALLTSIALFLAGALAYVAWGPRFESHPDEA